MDKQTKKLAVILGAVDAVVLVVFVIALVLSLRGANGGSAGTKQEDLKVMFDGGEIVGADSYVIKAPEDSVPEVDSDVDLDGDYIFPNSDSAYLTEDDLEGLSDWELKLARNEIYARHGRMFEDSQLSEYFSSKSWYNPTYTADEFDAKGDSVFNKYEIANRDLIREVEKR